MGREGAAGGWDSWVLARVCNPGPFLVSEIRMIRELVRSSPASPLLQSPGFFALQPLPPPHPLATSIHLGKKPRQDSADSCYGNRTRFTLLSGPGNNRECQGWPSLLVLPVSPKADRTSVSIPAAVAKKDSISWSAPTARPPHFLIALPTPGLSAGSRSLATNAGAGRCHPRPALLLEQVKGRRG